MYSIHILYNTYIIYSTYIVYNAYIYIYILLGRDKALQKIQLESVKKVKRNLYTL